MIYATVGSQKFQFDRLLKELDNINSNGEEIFAQTGYSNYSPKNYKFEKFLTFDEHIKKINQCNLLICHGGTSSIIEGLKYKKKVIVIPRLTKFNEHVDDHQLEISNVFKEKKYVEVVTDISHLQELINNVKYKKLAPYPFNSSNLIKSIKKDAMLFLNE